MIGKGYKQTATYWGAPMPNGTGGYTYAAPITMQVRWEERQEQFSNEQGEILVSQAVVFVPQDVVVGGYLYLGTSTAPDPTSVDGAYEIRRMIKIPDLRNAVAERRAFL
jgi:hypothetical protein